jgi:hypothetical protein
MVQVLLTISGVWRAKSNLILGAFGCAYQLRMSAQLIN